MPPGASIHPNLSDGKSWGSWGRVFTRTLRNKSSEKLPRSGRAGVWLSLSPLGVECTRRGKGGAAGRLYMFISTSAVTRSTATIHSVGIPKKSARTGDFTQDLACITACICAASLLLYCYEIINKRYACYIRLHVHIICVPF